MLIPYFTEEGSSKVYIVAERVVQDFTGPSPTPFVLTTLFPFVS